VDECKPLVGGSSGVVATHTVGAYDCFGIESLLHPAPGRAMQVDPIIPTWKAPGTERLKLKYD
jgi:hypothetical protein